jgi:amino acid permease
VSWHAALSSVAERISQFASHFDWFQHKMKETGMVSPCGTSTTTLTSVINLISGTLDAALLSTPLIMSYCGWLLSLFLFIMLALLGVFTTRILVTVCIAEHTESYHMTIFRTLGRHVMNGYQVLLIAGTLGSLMAYLMLVGDFAQAALLFITHVPINRRHAIIGFTLFFVLPLSLLRKLKSLWFTGFLSIGFMSFFAVALFVKLGQYGVTSSSGRGDGHVFAVHATAESVFQALPLTAFSLTNHANVIPVFHEMRCRTVAAFTTVSAWTYGIIGTMFFLTA